ncbi:MAG: D-aminoacylase [Gemmataceae bacterium]
MTATALLALLLAALPSVDPAIEADVVLRNGSLHDGTGGPPQVGDVALRGDRIVAVGTFRTAGTPRVIDATGLVVAPGFIDLHSHSDYWFQDKETRGNLSYLYQGVTTVITGNCGAGPVEVAAYFRGLEKDGVGSNVGHLVPHNTVRERVMKNANRPPSPAELARMAALVEQGMKDGARGLSTGLIYTPGSYAQTDELIALAKAAGKHGGLYVSHIRDEGAGVLAAVDEALRIGKEAGVPVHLSHLKASGRRAWGKAADVVALIERARQAGQVVTADQYPYTASSTSLAATLIPPRYREGTAAAYRQRLHDPAVRRAITAALADSSPAAIRIARYSKKPAWQGKDLATLASEQGRPVEDVVLAVERNGGAQIVHFSMREEDVRLILRRPWVATASDGVSQDPTSDTVPHPRSYGTFPRKVGRYAVEERVLPLEQAVRSCTGLPADVVRLAERGYLRVGYVADVVAFDPATFRDVATFDKPHQYARGVRHLFVNGQPAIADGKATDRLAGRPLRRR